MINPDDFRYEAEIIDRFDVIDDDTGAESEAVIVRMTGRSPRSEGTISYDTRLDVPRGSSDGYIISRMANKIADLNSTNADLARSSEEESRHYGRRSLVGEIIF